MDSETKYNEVKYAQYVDNANSFLIDLQTQCSLILGEFIKGHVFWVCLV